MDKKNKNLFFIFLRDTCQVSWGNNKIKTKDVLKNETLIIPPFGERKIRLLSTSLVAQASAVYWPCLTRYCVENHYRV
jgi:ABC-type antimicrobial peptide transport system permease subunit